MRSSDVLTAVVRRMNLTTDPEFRSERPPVMENLRSALLRGPADGGAAASTDRSPETRRENYTTALLRSRLWVHRIGQSTIIEISAASSAPGKSALIANNVADEYISQNVRRNSEAALQASQWLAQRVTELKEAVLNAERDVVMFQSSGDPASQFRLVELKSVAETTRRLYETYLQRWSEAKQRISYPVSDASFVSRASAPLAKSQPKTLLLLGFSAMLGLSFGVVVAIVRRVGNRLVTSASRISTEADTPCIGEIAKADLVKTRRGAYSADLLRPESIGLAGRASFDRDLRDLGAMLAGLRRNRKANLFGLVGTEAWVGTTTLAYNLARFASAAGSKTLLVDASSTNPTLSRIFCPRPSVGLMEVLNDPVAYGEFVGRIDKRLTVLAVGAVHDVTPGERIGSERIAFNLADLRDRFDLILVDLPSMADSSDAKSIAPYLDGTLVVVRHGKSTFDGLAESVNVLRYIGANVVGVVLNGSPHRKR